MMSRNDGQTHILGKVNLSRRRGVFGPKTLYWNCTPNTES
jgi:hypothetical protein